MGDPLVIISRCEVCPVGAIGFNGEAAFQVVCKETRANEGHSTVIILITINTAERKEVGKHVADYF